MTEFPVREDSQKILDALDDEFVAVLAKAREEGGRGYQQFHGSNNWLSHANLLLNMRAQILITEAYLANQKAIVMGPVPRIDPDKSYDYSGVNE